MKLSLLAVVAGLAVVTLPLAGCATDTGEDAASSDDAFTGKEVLHNGDKVFTTANLNLREKPSLTSNVITVIPKGSSLTLSAEDATTEVADEALDDVDGPDVTTEAPDPADPDADPAAPAADPAPKKAPTQTVVPGGIQGTDGFYHVTFGSTSGWAFGKYLSKPGAKPAGDTEDLGTANTSTSNAAATSCMTKAAQAGKSRAGNPSGGRCYHYVKEHVGKALGIGFNGVQSLLGSGYQVSAFQFARWVGANPGGRASGAGFVKSNVSLDALPLGAILVWEPGQCGYNRTHGHIEVNIGGGRACSDFCGTIKRTCGRPTVILLQKNSCGN